jgi:hypothetical protein
MGSGDVLVHGAHLLAASFSRTYLSGRADPFTGGGLVIVTLSAQRGVTYYTYSELPAEALGLPEKDIGDAWRHLSPELVTLRPISRVGQSSPGRVLKHGRIISMLTHEGLLSVLTAAETRLVTATLTLPPSP